MLLRLGNLMLYLLLIVGRVNYIDALQYVKGLVFNASSPLVQPKFRSGKGLWQSTEESVVGGPATYAARDNQIDARAPGVPLIPSGLT